MKTSGAAILMLMLSLAAAALLAADAVVAFTNMDTILLPSDGAEAGLVAGQVMAVAATGAVEEKKEEEPPAREEERPWACCNQTLCTKSSPPTCRCLDLVHRCAAACRQCEPSSQNPFLNVCNDQYKGPPGPTCSKHDDDVPSGAYGRSSPSIAPAARLLLAIAVVLFIHSHY